MMATADGLDALSVECRERATAAPAPPAQAPGWAPDRAPDRAAQWPLQSYLELSALPTAVGCARLHARQSLGEWGLRELAETIELVSADWGAYVPDGWAGKIVWCLVTNPLVD